MTDSPSTVASAAVPVPPPAPVPSGWHPVPNSARTIIIVVLIVVVGILAILAAWRLPPFSGAVERTDNAYVKGETTLISPQVSGYVWTVYVQDYEEVKAGQVLVKIDDRIYRQRVEQARAQLDAQKAALANNVQSLASKKASRLSSEAVVQSSAAQLLRAQADSRRAEDLVKDGSISRREADQTQAALRQAQAAVAQSHAGRDIAGEDIRTVEVNQGSLAAGVEAAQAALHATEIDLENTVVRAPESGRLGDVGVRVGQYVTNGSQLFFLVPPHLWVVANFKEAQTAHMTPGQKAWFSVDALDDGRVNGRIERISPAAGSEFAVLKADNATGNFIKVAQRISVRISVDANQALAARLRPGMSVEARVNTRSGPSP